MRLSDQVHMLPPPPGHCYLYQAVNAVGRVKIGSDWTGVCCQDELRGRMRDPSAALQVTIKAIADACTDGEIKASYRNRDGGIDDIDRAEWAKQIWETYFASGEVILYLPWVPPIPGSLARCERQIFVRKDSLKHFIANVSAAPLPALEKPSRSASTQEVRSAMFSAARDPVNDRPNVKQLAKLVVAHLRSAGLIVSENRVIELADDPEFKALRRPPGKTKRSGA